MILKNEFKLKNMIKWDFRIFAIASKYLFIFQKIKEFRIDLKNRYVNASVKCLTIAPM